MMNGAPTSIWYLIHSLEVGGAENTLVDLANNLDSERFDVTIWTILDQNPLATELREEVGLRTLAASGKHDILAAARFLQQVRQHNPDIIQSFLFFDNLLARLSGVACPETTVISGVRSVPENPSSIRSVLDRLSLPLANHVVSNSQAGKQMAINRGSEPKQTHVIENGRDLDEYATASAQSDLRSSLGIPASSLLVGTVGRLIERKGHYDLLEAWPDVQVKHPDSHLLIVGDGPEREGIKAKARNKGCTDSVTIAGQRNDVPELLNTIDVFVFPSHFEGLPGALIEAMAAGLPIVATSATGNSEVITNYETGLLVPVRNPSELANQLSTLLSNEIMATVLGERAAAESVTRFSLDRMMSEFTDLYLRILCD